MKINDLNTKLNEISCVCDSENNENEILLFHDLVKIQIIGKKRKKQHILKLKN